MDFSAQIYLPNAAATDAFAAAVAPHLHVGSCLLLDGPIGAGKTAFARALIQSLIGADEEVPSPTFTLVQTYKAPEFEIWHCDLYRLSSVDELIELGLDEAFEAAVTLIEWPDRLGDMAPTFATRLLFDTSPTEGRNLTLSGSAEWIRKVVA